MLDNLPENAKQNLIVIECAVERHPYKVDANKDLYFYRKHPVLKLRSVPTIMHWDYSNTDNVVATTRLWNDEDFVSEKYAEFAASLQ